MHLQQDEDQEVENLALARLKQAASKNNKSSVDNNGVHSANLVSLTGSPGLKDRKLSGGNRSDMEVSDDEASEVRDTFLDTESYPPPVRPSPGGLLPSPWENGRPPQHAGPPPGQDRFAAPPPPVFLPRPGFNGSQDNNPAFHNTNRPPPFLPSPGDPADHPPALSPMNANLQPLGGGFDPGASPSESGRGRGGFRPNRGFGQRGRGGEDSGPSPRFPGGPGPRFPGPHHRGGGGGFPHDRFSDGDNSEGRGGHRGRGGGFRGGHHKEFDSGGGGNRGGFDRGRGGPGPRGGWNGARRPWMRGRGGPGGPRGGGNW